ncbi:hypothetical protein FH608_042005 [Nonomuraea phyllanthi]|uniref:Uncharacterized protein n=1 Tax=Nonomuraea phyllanthi TaxID=2219224 RepID=A0A5C4VHB2_9ACTN|nr:ATP-binding protein [Nonomuraea phyllanthi]KAB8189038.1 hypothetical protein FH608_042005 [Nonomuraea phyllanthi]
MSQPHVEHGTAGAGEPALRMWSWNGLLALGDNLAVRAGWAGQDRAASWLLSARPSAVPSARRMTAVRLNAWGLHEQAAIADRLVGELVGEALRHATGKIRLALWVEDGLLRSEAEDLGARVPPALPRHNPLLDRLACCWGVAGRIVWFELLTSERH